MKKRARMDSPAYQADASRAPPTPTAPGPSTVKDGSSSQSPSATVADAGERSIRGQMTPTMEDAMILQNRIHMLENRQQQQYRDRVIEQSNQKLMADKIEGILTTSNELISRIDLIEFSDRQQIIQELQAQILEIKQEQANMRNQHQQQLAHATALISSAFGSPAKEQKSKDNSNEGHIYDDGTSSEVEQMILLPLLQTMDFCDPRHLRALKKIEDYEINMSMFHPNEKYNNEGIAYLVRARGPFSEYLVTSDRKNPYRAEKGFWKSREWNEFPTVLELSAHQKETFETPAFPKYVWEIGEIYVRRLDKETKKYMEISTGYHLVVDITMPQKSVWMLNRCVEHDIDGKIERNTTQVTDPFWHPFATGANDICDAAVVFANIKDWSGIETKLGQFAKSMALVKKTRRNMNPVPTFIKPILLEVMAVIQRGWQAKGPE